MANCYCYRKKVPLTGSPRLNTKFFTANDSFYRSAYILLMFINGKINFRVRVSRSKIHGRGLYATNDMPAKRKIGSLSGQLISKKLKRAKARAGESITLVELLNGKTLNASVNSNELRYINHSCNPNTYMRTLGNHVEFYTLRRIYPEEELTCNYGPTHHDGNKRCTCGAKGCKGFI